MESGNERLAATRFIVFVPNFPSLSFRSGVGTRKDEFDLVAVKTIKEVPGTDNMFGQEVELMSLLRHENIVLFLGISVSDDPQMMIFEYMEYGDLNNYLR